MESKRIEFPNSRGELLSARLELPTTDEPRHFAIFAHCFTCGKNSRAAATISRELAGLGIGVLRFDFTGLGDSEGDFADTAFTTNVRDLVTAGEWLAENYASPALLIGHSLGGTAVIHAAAEMDSIRAVCTIGAPMEAKHVEALLSGSREELLRDGKAAVHIGGRSVCIGAQFLTDLELHSTASILPKLRKPLLILHSPQDQIVGIDQAAAIYQAAFHPKSFVSLDGANHLLTDNEDASYAADIIAVWVKRYL